MVKILLALTLACSTHLHAAICAGANGYTFCQSLILDHTKVPGNLTNYPAVFCFDATIGVNCLENSKQLATVSNGGFLQDTTNGFDFIVTSDAGGTVPLSYEAAIHNLTTGAAEIWVKLPSVSSTVDLTIYLFYGNAAVMTDQSHPTLVWDANFLAVHHHNQLSGTISTAPDSTSNGFTLSDYSAGVGGPPVGTSGEIGGAAGMRFDYLNYAGPYTSFPNVAPFTLEGWFDPTNVTGINGAGAYCIGDNIQGHQWNILFDDVAIRWVIAGTSVNVTFTGGTVGKHRIVTVLPSGQTTYLGATVYVDGVSKSLTDLGGGSTTVNITYPTTGQFAFTGYRSSGVCGFGDHGPVVNEFQNGIVDEERLSNIERTSNWVVTDYNNQSNPAAFWSFSKASGGASGRTIIIN